MDLKNSIMQAATDIAERRGIAATTRDAIANKVPCSTGSVSYHWGDARKLARAIVEAAIRNRNLRVIGWAIAEKHPTVLSIDPALYSAAIRKHLEP